jgi:hypothetical protein
MSPDDGTFDQLYQSLPPGLIVVACGGGAFQPLQSFCFSLKGAAIRKGTDAMHFDWDCSLENWDATGGIQRFRDFVELNRSHNVRLFFIDGSPKSGSPTKRAAELIRSPMARGSIDHSVAELIREFALSKSVTVIVTAIAEILAAERVQGGLKDLDAAIHKDQGALTGMRDGYAQVERQFRLPNAEASIAALPGDLAEQMRQTRESLPEWALKIQQAEAHIAKNWSESRKN